METLQTWMWAQPDTYFSSQASLTHCPLAQLMSYQQYLRHKKTRCLAYELRVLITALRAVAILALVSRRSCSRSWVFRDRCRSCALWVSVEHIFQGYYRLAFQNALNLILKVNECRRLRVNIAAFAYTSDGPRLQEALCEDCSFYRVLDGLWGERVKLSGASLILCCLINRWRMDADTEIGGANNSDIILQIGLAAFWNAKR